MTDALRLVLGTLTIVPVPPPRRVDRRTAGLAMAAAPVVGLLLGLLVVLVLRVLDTLPSPPSPLLQAVLSLAVLAVLTRGMHLDGLADTADGLGSRRPADEALRLMRAGDVGPFGVATLVLVLLAQAAALAQLLARGDGPSGVVLACVVSRFALPLLCSAGVGAARQDGLGSAVAGSVSRVLLGGSALLAAVAVAGVTALGGHHGATPAPIAAVLVGLVPPALAGLLALRCVRRLGGVTGDVLGAGVEVAFTAALLVACLL